MNTKWIEGARTLRRSPGAVIEEGEIQIVIHATIRRKDPDLWGNHITGIRRPRRQRQHMASLQAPRQTRPRTRDDAVRGSGGDGQRLDAAVLSYVEDKGLTRQFIVVEQGAGQSAGVGGGGEGQAGGSGGGGEVVAAGPGAGDELLAGELVGGGYVEEEDLEDGSARVIVCFL